MTFQPGLQIGKYELGKKLGQGGFGAVYVAQDTGLDRAVALKFLHPEHTASQQILQRFMQEARSAAKIVHPGIVTIYECGIVSGTGTIDGTAFIAMELLHGESLTDRLARSGRLAPPAAMEVCRQLASALEAAHRAGIVHRDLKPDNVFLVTDPAVPSGERVKILDFGIAKLAQSASISNVHTASMMVFGTPRYMSPEQCKSATNIDHRSDIYTLGCILFELVCGKLPFDGQAGELIAKHQLVEPPRASKFSDLPGSLDQLIADMLAKEPDERPQTMAHVQRALIASGAESSSGSAPTLHPDALSGSHITPGVFGIPPNIAPTLAPASPNPTTLSGATGASQIAPRSRAPYIVIGVLGIAAAAGALVLATRKHDDKPIDKPELAIVSAAMTGSAAPGSGQPIPVVTPIVDAAVVAVVVDAAEAHADPPPPPPAPAMKHVTAVPPPATINVVDVATNLARGCFDRYAKTHPAISGALSLKLAVDVAGRGTAKAAGLVADIDDCFVRKFATWKFPRERTPISLTTSVAYQSSVTPDQPETKVPVETKIPVETKHPGSSEPCVIKDKVVDPFNKTPCPQ